MLRESVQLLWRNWQHLWRFVALDWLLSLIPMVAAFMGHQVMSPLGLSLTLMCFGLQAWLQVALVKVLKLCLRQPSQSAGFNYRDLAIWSLGRLPGFVFYLLLYYLMIVGGFFILIIPSFLAAVIFAFTPYASLLEDEWGPLTYSRMLVKGHFFKIAGMMLLVLLLNGFGLAAELLPEQGTIALLLNFALLSLGALGYCLSTILIVKNYFQLEATLAAK